MEFDDDENVIVLPCDDRHFFHKECIVNWFRSATNYEILCPLCKTDILPLAEKLPQPPETPYVVGPAAATPQRRIMFTPGLFRFTPSPREVLFMVIIVLSNDSSNRCDMYHHFTIVSNRFINYFA